MIYINVETFEVAGQAFGNTLNAISKGGTCTTKIGKVIKVTSQVTKVISLGLDGFDMVAMGIGFFDPNNPLVQINQKLHSSAAYNVLQVGVNALAIFTGAASSTMKCFVAGTMILTAVGLVAIENIKAGDKVISTNPETFETAEKTVLETYVREDNKLIHLTINGEKIVTTETPPFYVKNEGFISAIDLYIGDKLLDSNNNTLLVEDVKVEITDTPTPVYNFQVKDFHTYHVGESCVLVHNAGSEYLSPRQMNQYRREVLDGKDIKFQTKEMAIEFIEKKYHLVKRRLTWKQLLLEKRF